MKLLGFLTLSLLTALSACGQKQSSTAELKIAGTCIDMRLEKQCGLKKTCEYSCQTGGAAGVVIVGKGIAAASGIAIISKFCIDSCADLEDCQTISICHKWDRKL